jgi:hypothetical protein
VTSIRDHSFHPDSPGQSMSQKEQVFIMFCSLSVHNKVSHTQTYSTNPVTHSKLNQSPTLRINDGGLTFPIGPILLIALHGKGPHDEPHVYSHTKSLCLRLIECVYVCVRACVCLVRLLLLSYECEATPCASQWHSSSV